MPSTMRLGETVVFFEMRLDKCCTVYFRMRLGEAAVFF